MELERMDSFFDTRVDSYDSHMLEELGLTEFYDEIENSLKTCIKLDKVLDLGCGTGLELERLFKVWDKAEVTAIDLSEGMLTRLKEKFSGRSGQLKLIRGSYMEADFGTEAYDCVVTTYSLHHFEFDEKLALYKSIHRSLKEGGCFIEGDYTVKTKEEERDLAAMNLKLRRESGHESGYYHFDIPLTPETQLKLFSEAGFSTAEIRKKWDNTTIFICNK
jgi:tRNA (cmo5U34)-methyltransferase